jgi:hypothetical protein
MKKIVKLTESDLTRIVKRVIKENEGDNMISIPKNFKGVRMELGKISTPEEIMSEYNYRVGEARQLASYSEDGFFIDETGDYIEVEVVLDDLEYAINGGDKGEEDDTIGPSPKGKRFGDGGESEFFLTDNFRFRRLKNGLALSYMPSKIGGGLSLSDEQKEMLINFLSK